MIPPEKEDDQPARSMDQLTPDEKTLLERFLAGAPYRDIGVLQGLTQHELDSFLELLSVIQNGENIPVDWMWQLDYREKPVDPEVFLRDEYYYGKLFPFLFKGWVPELEFVLDPNNRVNEWVISGAIGTGKSSVAVVAQLYKLYHLSLLKNPQAFYGLEPHSMICLGLFNTTLDKTDLTLHYKFQQVLATIPYFRDRFPFVKTKYKRVEDYQIVLPKNIRLISGSNAMHALSLDLYGGILDEQNFREGRNKNPYMESNAYRLYRQTKLRITSRFRSDSPSLLINISSANTMTDFLAEHLEKKADDPRIHVSRFAHWEIKPDDYEGLKPFYVVVGDKHNSSRILKDDDPIPAEQQIVGVPDHPELRQQFTEDIESALRDLAGVDTVGGGRLLPAREKLKDAVAKGELEGLIHPFTKQEPILSLDDPTKLEDLFLPRALIEEVGRGKRLRRHPEAPRYIHVDLAVNGDNAGISMGHVATTSSVQRWDPRSGKKFSMFVPVIEMDFMLRIPPPVLGQIDFGKIVEFIEYLRDSLNIPIGFVSYDGFQSQHSVQILLKNRFTAKVVSVSKKDDAYLMLRQAIMEGRFVCYSYNPFEDELVHLIHDPRKKKVDHMKGRHNDCADSVAGVVIRCMEESSVGSPTQEVLPQDAVFSSLSRRQDGSIKNWALGDYKKPEKRKILDIKSFR